MPPTIGTIDQVIARLNTDEATRRGAPWIEANGFSTLTAAELGPSVQFKPGEGLVLKAFISTTTAEVRVFLVKLLEIPERNSLF